MSEITCRDCPTVFTPPVQRGRKPTRCPVCAKVHNDLLAAPKPDRVLTCSDCGGSFDFPSQRGAVPSRCGECKTKHAEETKTAYIPVHTAVRELVCKDCAKPFTMPSRRGKPPSRCDGCKAVNIAAPKPAAAFSPYGSHSPVSITSEDASKLDGMPQIVVKVPVTIEESKVETDPDHIVWHPKERPAEVPLGSHTYEVTCTNVQGYLYRGEELSDANKTYEKLSDSSLRGFGQVGGETVRLYEKGELAKEFNPKTYKEGF